MRASNTGETRLLARALTDPVELKKKLILAIALAPPKAQAGRNRPKQSPSKR